MDAFEPVNRPSVVSLDSSIKRQGNLNDKMFLGIIQKRFLAEHHG